MGNAAKTQKFPASEKLPIPDFIDQKYYPSLDGLRAIAIFAVIIAHISGTSADFLGFWGVYLFFVRSGFLITTLLIREKQRTGTISLRLFYARRALRIFPAAFFFIIAMLIFNKIYDLGISNKDFITTALYIKNIPFAMEDRSWYLGHFWTLSVEEQYYLFAPLIILVSYSYFRVISVILILCSYTVAFFAYHERSSLFGLGSTPLIYAASLLEFQIPLFIGSLTSLLICEGKIKIPSVGSFLSVLIILVSLLFQSEYLHFIIPTLFVSTLSSLCFAVLIVSGIQNDGGWFFYILNTNIIKRIGVLSYSIYIWQQIFTRSQFLIENNNPPLSMVYNILALLIVSCFSHYVVERYFMRLKASFVPV